ncbi:MAG: hypothetical protein LBD88_04820, partial [Candidatus Peribacteria bacterium]|nr:hypothetical protein [Candidatus Peribacteria bacterium]
LPDERLSTFAITKSGEYSLIKDGNSFIKAFLQILPYMSQKIRSFIKSKITSYRLKGYHY